MDEKYIKIYLYFLGDYYCPWLVCVISSGLGCIVETYLTQQNSYYLDDLWSEDCRGRESQVIFSTDQNSKLKAVCISRGSSEIHDTIQGLRNAGCRLPIYAHHLASLACAEERSIWRRAMHYHNLTYDCSWYSGCVFKTFQVCVSTCLLNVYVLSCHL